MKDLSYIEATKIVLEKAKIPLKTAEIWKEILNENLDKRLKSIGKTPQRSLHTILLNHIQGKEPEIFVFSENPRTFWLTKNRDKITQKEVIIEKIQQNEEQETKNTKFSERDLHPLFVRSLFESEFNARAKTIYHEKSKAKSQGINKWLHPDIVAVHFVFDDFKNQQTISLLKKINKVPYKLYSFELKIKLDSRFKEYYFQAVSNSSWANEGYLAVFKKIDEDILEELKRLNQSFGIGVIEFGTNSNDFEILLPAIPRELDIKTIDKLIRENDNFKEFIEYINNKVETHGKGFKIESNFDEILNDEKLEKYLKEKHIDKE